MQPNLTLTQVRLPSRRRWRLKFCCSLRESASARNEVKDRLLKLNIQIPCPPRSAVPSTGYVCPGHQRPFLCRPKPGTRGNGDLGSYQRIWPEAQICDVRNRHSGWACSDIRPRSCPRRLAKPGAPGEPANCRRVQRATAGATRQPAGSARPDRHQRTAGKSGPCLAAHHFIEDTPG